MNTQETNLPTKGAFQAECACETPARIALLLTKDTTPFDDYITIETAWKRFAAALIKADIRDPDTNRLLQTDSFMLMEITNGEAQFKNITTRAYCYLQPDNRLIARGLCCH